MSDAETKRRPPSSRRWEELRELQLDNRLVAALRSLGFESATPVQAVGIPPLLRRLDVAVDAETGSGKTLAFLVPALQMLLCSNERSPLGVLIIEPTRELAKQVYNVALRLTDALKGCEKSTFRVQLLTGGGGSGDGPLAGALDIVIATPGRLVAALSSAEINVRQLHLLILDEADRLLDCGFEVELASIFARLPKQRRTGLYSATQTTKVRELARAGLRNPVRVAVERVAGPSDEDQQSKVPSTLASFFLICEQEKKLAQLVSFISSNSAEKIIVYFLTCFSVEFHSKLPWAKLLALSSSKVEAVPGMWSLHGKMTQNRRSKALRSFEESESGVLFCTDVAARGIDIPDVDWIVQFDPPQDPDAYVHRVGRTARLGRRGKAVVYLTAAEEEYVDFLGIRKCTAVPMAENPPDVCNEKVKDVVREAILKDRDILEKAEKAFLSFLRGYKEHRCCYILQFDKLDFAGVARSFHLLRMPRVAEFRKYRSKIAKFEADRTVDLKSIKFQSRELERQRQVKLAKIRNEPSPKRRQTGPRGKRQKQSRRAVPTVTGSNNALDADELDELAEDARALKRMKRKGGGKRGFSSDESSE